LYFWGKKASAEYYWNFLLTNRPILFANIFFQIRTKTPAVSKKSKENVKLTMHSLNVSPMFRAKKSKAKKIVLLL